MIFVVLGPDRLLARTAVNKLAGEHDPAGDNTSRFDADSDSLDMVMNGVATPSFFGGERVIVATGFLTRLKSSQTRSNGKSKSVHKSSQAPERGLQAIVETAMNQAVLIVHDPELSSIPTGLRSIFPDSVAVSAHQPPRGQQLIDLAMASFAKRGAMIDRDTVRHLLNRLFAANWQQPPSNPAFDQAPDIESLINEIEKLSIAAESTEITEELIDELTLQASEERLFPLLDAIVTGNTRPAFQELRSLPASDDERSRVLAQVLQQIEFVAAASQPGRPADPLQAGRELGMTNPNRMKPVLRTLSDSRVPQEALLEIAVEADRRIKRGIDPEPEDALYQLILESASSEKR